LFEFVDAVIPCLPKSLQEQYSKSNEDARQRYLEYVRTRKEPDLPPPRPEMKFTASQVRLMGRIRRYGGEAWFPGDSSGYRSWKSIGGEPGFRVRLEGQSVKMVSIAKLAELGDVEVLGLEGPDVTDELFDPITTFPGLRHLLLHDTQVSDAGLQHLQGLHQLEHLSLGHTDDRSPSRITDASLKYIAGLKKLRYLYLTKTQISDDGLKHLSGMTSLLGLDLSNTKITSEGLKHIAPLRQLRTLNLYGTQVDDKAVEHLQGFSELESLTLFYSKVTPEGVARIRQLLPDAEIRQ